MEQMVLKIAVAAMIHDLGKLVEDKELAVPGKPNNDAAGHTHLWKTAALITQCQEKFPQEFITPGEEGHSLRDLAGGYMQPDTPLQCVVAMADRISSGWGPDMEREAYEAACLDYRPDWLRPIVARLNLNPGRAGNNLSAANHHYPLDVVSAETIFPTAFADTPGVVTPSPKSDYGRLWQQFRDSLGGLRHREENPALWFEHFDSLMMLHTAAVPAFAGPEGWGDVSLYDHARTTAALAPSIYLYHRQRDTLQPKAIGNWRDQKFLLISGDFSGIQNFIFSEHGDTRKYRAKILRGRSFAVSLFSELAGDLLCREIGLPFSSIVFNAAGKFMIIAPNTPEAEEALSKAEKQINDWLISIAYGESTMSFASREAAAQDLLGGNFANLWEQLSEDLEMKKLARLDLEQHGGPIADYFKGFSKDFRPPICSLCGKRPKAKETEGDPYLRKLGPTCKTCRDHVFLGTKLVRETPRLAVTTVEAPVQGDEKLLEPIFGAYQVAFLTGGLTTMASKGELLRYWDLTIDPQGQLSRDIAVKFINGYVPVHRDVEADKVRIEVTVKSEAKKKELLEQIEEDAPKTLEFIASTAKGIEALGILKADADNLGALMNCGLPEEDFSLSRLAALSRQLHNYFALYLPYFLKTREEFKDTYTVFAGGDDLFLIGPWNRIIELIMDLQGSFARYVGKNKKVHFSGGIVLQKPHSPLPYLAEAVEEALSQSKSEGRDCLTLFGETVAWNKLEELWQIKETLTEWLEKEKGWINTAMLYRLNELLQMAGEENLVRKHGAVHIDDLACLRWRPLLVYVTDRNIVKAVKGEARSQAIKEVKESAANWLEKYGSKLKIPLWSLLYDRR